MFKGGIDERARQAEKLLSRIVPGAICVPQEWDSRIDCLLELGDGRVVGEMVALSQLTEQRIRETGERLRQHGQGVEVPLVDELHPPVRIVSRPRP
jgi:hypothetical protein